jgi:hypothetical protein
VCAWREGERREVLRDADIERDRDRDTSTEQ